MTMKQACEYIKQSRRQRAKENMLKHKNERSCSGLTEKEYFKVEHKQKSSFSKARKFTHNKMWQESFRRFDTEPVKL